MSGWRALVVALAALTWPTAGLTHDIAHHGTDPLQHQRLPTIGRAPDFDLTSQDGQRVTLADYRGKVVAVAFIYTSCPDICPMLTANMQQVQERLGGEFGTRIAFISITVDPERDTPEVLRQYAESFGAKLEGWSFLTGDPATVKDVAQRYGIYARKAANRDINHTLLTSIIDPSGMMRVQYLGYSFDLEEFRSDLLSLVGEAE
jgi:protein SCO1